MAANVSLDLLHASEHILAVYYTNIVYIYIYQTISDIYNIYNILQPVDYTIVVPTDRPVPQSLPVWDSVSGSYDETPGDEVPKLIFFWAQKQISCPNA